MTLVEKAKLATRATQDELLPVMAKWPEQPSTHRTRRAEDIGRVAYAMAKANGLSAHQARHAYFEALSDALHG